MQTKFTRAEFSKDCDVPNNTLTILAKRGKIAINSARCESCKDKKKPCTNCKAHEFIDLDYRTKDGHYINLDFFKERTKGIEAPKKARKVRSDKKDPIVKKHDIVVPEMINDEDDDRDEEEMDEGTFGELTANSSEAALSKGKKFAEMQNKKADTRLKELKEAQMKGELIPVDMVQEVIQIFAETVKRAYSDAGENLIMLISERLGAQDHDKAFMRTKLLDSTNKAIDDSVNEAQSKISTSKEEAEDGL